MKPISDSVTFVESNNSVKAFSINEKGQVLRWSYQTGKWVIYMTTLTDKKSK